MYHHNIVVYTCIYTKVPPLLFTLPGAVRTDMLRFVSLQITLTDPKVVGTEKIRSRWRNGLARLQQWLCYLQGPGFESHLLPVEFFACNKVSPLNNRAPTLISVPCASIN